LEKYGGGLALLGVSAPLAADPKVGF
jgi:hypothetical protein